METQRIASPAAKASTLRAILIEGARFLQEAGIKGARLDAEVLLRRFLAVEPVDLFTNLDAILSDDCALAYRRLLERRAAREPVAYITGWREFWSLDLEVTPDVLIPRPETELVVEIALKHAEPLMAQSRLDILDLGTGSGAIAVALAREIPQATITAVDSSKAALQVARKNSESNGIADRIEFVHSDLFADVARSFDVIVSNPPYVRRRDLADLPAEIREWEPMIALDGGLDGLDYYRRIVVEAASYLATGGALILEIGVEMGRPAAELFNQSGRYAEAVLYQDCAGRDRVIAVRRAAAERSVSKGDEVG